MRPFHLLMIPLCAVLATARLPAADDKKVGEFTPPTEIAGKSLKQWVAEIKDPDPGVVENAIRTVLHFGRDAREAGPNLILQLDSLDASLRANSAIALGTLNKELSSGDITKAVEKLGNHVTDDSQMVVRFHCVLALSKFGADAKPALSKLISASQDTRCWEIRKMGVIALAAVAGDRDKGPDARAIAALREALVNSNCSEVRQEAAVALAILGRPSSVPEALATAEALKGKFSDKDKSVCVWARVAYMAFDEINETQLKEVTKYLKSPDVATKGSTLRALSTIGAKAEAHIPEMIALLHDKEPTVAAAAASALVLMDRDSLDNRKDAKVTARLKKEVVPVLNELLKDRNLDEALRQTLQAALGQLGDKPAEKVVKPTP
jgi:HEAT repeat protein